MLKYFKYLTSYSYKSSQGNHSKHLHIAYKIADLTIRFPKAFKHRLQSTFYKSKGRKCSSVAESLSIMSKTSGLILNTANYK